jgi:hypothetical protein
MGWIIHISLDMGINLSRLDDISTFFFSYSNGGSAAGTKREVVILTPVFPFM